MAEEARLFGDKQSRARILAATSPAPAKKLGRAVRDFDNARCGATRFEIVVRGNLLKSRAALRLDLSSQFARGQVASALHLAGRVTEAEEECREALWLYPSKCESEPAQLDAILRWALAECLRRSDKAAEAVPELEIAVSLQRAAVTALAGSPG